MEDPQLKQQVQCTMTMRATQRKQGNLFAQSQIDKEA